MTFHYSAVENQFLISSMMNKYKANNNWPADAIPVDDKIVAQYMSDPPEGMIRVAGDDGYPMWI